MATDKGRIKELLGSGLGTDVVAQAVGCDPSYISQLLSEPDFAEEVVKLRTISLTAHTERDKKIDSIEDMLIEQLHEAVETRQVFRPTDILRTFAVVNAARRRGVAASSGINLTQNIVQLQLPEAVFNKFTKTQHGEVVDVSTSEGQRQTLVTMPASTLLKHLAEKGKDNERYKEVGRHLPITDAGAGIATAESSSGK